MTHQQFLQKAIGQGIEAANRDYSAPHQLEKRNGSVAGFEACRDLTPPQLAELLEAARTSTSYARINQLPNYWWYRCYEAEVEWICNVVSATLHNQNLPTIITPTARGVMTAASILGS